MKNNRYILLDTTAMLLGGSIELAIQQLVWRPYRRYRFSTTIFSVFIDENAIKKTWRVWKGGMLDSGKIKAKKFANDAFSLG